MSPATRNETAGIVRLRRLFLLVAVLLAVAIAIGVTRFDIGGTIDELTLPLRHDDIIRQQAREKDVPADLIAAVIYQESEFVDQTSSAGARGLMQITPDTADTIETLSGGETFVYEDLADPDLNIRYGTFYLRHLLDRFEGNEVAALAAYNAGPEQAEQWGGAGMAIDDIEFPETSHYVEDVLERREEYRDKYAEELGLR
jgi:soluble lytic murein transglycosylase